MKLDYKGIKDNPSIPSRPPDNGGLTSVVYYQDKDSVLVFTVDMWKLIYWKFYLKIITGQALQQGFYQQGNKRWPVYSVEVKRLSKISNEEFEGLTHLFFDHGKHWLFLRYE